MRIVFMGTPDFAVASLQKLIDENYDVVGVFTQPDKPRNRGMKLSFSPVKELAIQAGIPVFQPEKMRDGTALEDMQSLKPDLIVVVAYGRILPDELIAAAPLGCINVHGSLLPKYRGSAPIQWSVLNGDKTTGVTTMYIASELDAGDMIYKAETEIGEFETSGELFDRLCVLGADLLGKTVRDIEAGTAPRIPQNAEEATFAPQLNKEMSVIDWNKTPREVVKWVCGMNPWPIATTEIFGVSFRVFEVAYTENKTDLPAGSVVSAGKQGIEMACGNGETLMIKRLQAAGGKRMDAAAYLLGHPLGAEGWL